MSWVIKSEKDSYLRKFEREPYEDGLVGTWHLLQTCAYRFEDRNVALDVLFKLPMKDNPHIVKLAPRTSPVTPKAENGGQ